MSKEKEKKDSKEYYVKKVKKTPKYRLTDGCEEKIFKPVVYRTNGKRTLSGYRKA